LSGAVPRAAEKYFVIPHPRTLAENRPFPSRCGPGVDHRKWPDCSTSFPKPRGIGPAPDGSPA
jgi:hypothetical protein